MAAAGTIQAARNEGTGTGAVSAPIYLGDSMQLRYDTGTLYASQSIELETHETLPGHAGPIIFRIPKELARQQADMDQLISEMATAIDEDRDTDHVTDSYNMSDECHQSIKAVATLMKDLHSADRNHVWAYYIRNMIRPAVLAEEKVDRIIGNPPWLTYGQSADIIRTELREMSERRYQIWAGGKLAPHQDIATLFYTRCAELYAKSQAIIGMVMPHSALRTGQHLKWRIGTYKRKGGRNAPRYRAELQGPRTVGPGQCGTRLLPDASQRDIRGVHRDGSRARHWRQEPCRCGVATGRKTMPTSVGTSQALHHEDGKFKSPYADLSSNGDQQYTDRRLILRRNSASHGNAPSN